MFPCSSVVAFNVQVGTGELLVGFSRGAPESRCDPYDLLTSLSGVFWSNNEKNQRSMSPTAWNNQVLFAGGLTFDKNLWIWIFLFTLFSCFIHFVLCNFCENCQSDIGMFNISQGHVRRSPSIFKVLVSMWIKTSSKNHEKNRSHPLYLHCLVVSGEKRPLQTTEICKNSNFYIVEVVHYFQFAFILNFKNIMRLFI